VLFHNKNNVFTKIDLLSKPKVALKLDPRFFFGRYRWKVHSGKWEIISAERAIYYKNPHVKYGENISTFGSNSWHNINLEIGFKILTESLKPPEGGLIIYLLFKNIKNYYSIHFCPSKNKIELIKRIKGNWSTVAEYNYDLNIFFDYNVSINFSSKIISCSINGKICFDKIYCDLSKGCIGIGVKYCDVEFIHISYLVPSTY